METITMPLPFEPPLTVTIEATIVGPLAVHHQIVANRDRSGEWQYELTSWWEISHIASGYTMGIRRRRKWDMLALAHRLQHLDFDAYVAAGYPKDHPVRIEGKQIIEEWKRDL